MGWRDRPVPDPQGGTYSIKASVCVRIHNFVNSDNFLLIIFLTQSLLNLYNLAGGKRYIDNIIK
jgi:hypothetical protein